ncbi:DUF2029 domain-containing protein [Mycobacterium sp. M1]|uniref:DUF2029 domain-containing protein n=1 Tax=Mycolicibacter acidiphilus TaxID=2835306 RepID=A0ABS5RFA3_9MYCO|nr:glycosyltransferase 87 family protein [Mycolicibacter acidiphilus]MBS9532970.1 DUF2029 domain-containing protein [Mycolicibacter acidiphilus]
MTTLRSPDPGRRRGGVTAWWAFSLLAVAALGYTTWQVLNSTPYHIDIDVYRMAAQAWRDGKPLYGDDWFHTQIDGTVLPFTYPPIAAVLFAPFTWVPLGSATAALTVISTALLVVSVTIVLTGLDVAVGPTGCGPLWWRRGIVATAIVAVAVWAGAEPVWANFDFGQINAVLMTLVLLDCVPQRTRWPRGALLGVAVALKLTPAVFLLYFLLRRDIRAAVTTVLSFLTATGVGFLLAWHDSWQYWTHTVRNTDRIGGASLNTNQNLAGALARLPLTDGQRSALWMAGSLLVLAVTVWAVRRVLRADRRGAPILALICVALFGLVVSPVSWSHHWVWMVPVVVALAVLAWQWRSAALGMLSAAGAALMVFSPIELLPEHHEAAAAGWRQLAGASYVWWALAVIITAGALKARTAEDQPAAVSGIRAEG